MPRNFFARKNNRSVQQSEVKQQLAQAASQLDAEIWRQVEHDMSLREDVRMLRCCRDPLSCLANGTYNCSAVRSCGNMADSMRHDWAVMQAVMHLRAYRRMLWSNQHGGAPGARLAAAELDDLLAQQPGQSMEPARACIRRAAAIATCSTAQGEVKSVLGAFDAVRPILCDFQAQHCVWLCTIIRAVLAPVLPISPISPLAKHPALPTCSCDMLLPQ